MRSFCEILLLAIILVASGCERRSVETQSISQLSLAGKNWAGELTEQGYRYWWKKSDRLLLLNKSQHAEWADAVDMPVVVDGPLPQTWLRQSELLWGQREQPYHLVWVADAAELHELTSAVESRAQLLGLGHQCGRLQVLRPHKPVRLQSTDSGQASLVHHPESKIAKLVEAGATVTESEIRSQIERLVNLGTRYYLEPGGASASQEVEAMFTAAGQGIENFSVTTRTHSVGGQTAGQTSVVARIEGTTDPESVVILGAHLDSIHRGQNDNAPGADDNASGIASLVEIIDAVADQGLKFAKSIEFHGYGIEEIGLIGSGDIASAYSGEARKVVGMLQLDMTAFYRPANGPAVNIILNDTDLNLSYQLNSINRTYSQVPTHFGTISGGTSDHKSWHDAGFPAAFIFEDPSDYNRNLHTENDTLATDIIPDLAQSVAFTQLALYYAGHAAGVVLSGEEVLGDQAALSSAGDLDLSLALWPGDVSGSYYAAVGVLPESAIAYVHLCSVSDRQAASCGTRLVLDDQKSQPLGGRDILVGSVAGELLSGDGVRLIAYNQDHEIVGYRQVQVTTVP